MDWWALTVIIFGILLLLMAIGVPIAFSLAGLAIAGFVIVWPEGLGAIGYTMKEVTTNWILVAVPLFVFMGEVISFSGVSGNFYDVAQKWTRALPGSLTIATTLMAGTFAALTGASAANTAAVGSIAIPEMLKRGYDKQLAVGSVAGGGALGILVPPSLAFILYGMLAGVSVSQLFIAGVLPGAMTVAVFCIYIVVRCIANPSLAPKIAPATWGERLRCLWKVWAVIVIIAVVLGTLYLGITTPTEAAGIGAFSAVLMALGHRRMTWQNLRLAMLASVRVTSMVLVLFVGGLLFSRLMVVLGVAPALTGFISSLAVDRWVIMIMINVLLLLLGCIIDPGSIILILTPLFVPIITQLGFDLIWFGVIFVINMECANLTPPLGYNLFVIKGIAPEVSMGDIIKGSLPFVFLFVLTMIIVMVFPQIALWLPSMMG